MICRRLRLRLRLGSHSPTRSSGIASALTASRCRIRRIRIHRGRTKETARLAFGRFVVSRALLNTIAAEHDARWRRQIQSARRLLGTRPAPGTLTVLVTHGSVVGDTTGHTLEEGEALVFRPLGSSRFTLLGRILPREWRTLRPA
jgi:hypothetical protein